MSNNPQLHFLQQKIAQLQQAIFHNESNAAVKLPTALVQCVGVDEVGFVWFWMRKPAQTITAFEHSFPVRLDFYRKGNNCFLQVAGNAQIVTNPEEVYDLPAVSSSMGLYEKGKVLVKVKMTRADYHEAQTTKAAGWWQTISHAAKTWLRPANGYARPQYAPAP